MINENNYVNFDKLYHVGTLNKNQKRSNSHEGSGLSVSTEPEAWVEISELTNGNLYELTKENNSFLDFYSLNDEQLGEMADWGIQNGYIKKTTLYRVSYYDGDFDQEMYFDLTDYQEAKMEMSGDEPEEVIGYIATNKLNRKGKGKYDSIMVLDILSTVYAEKMLDIDGVWWKDTLDIARLSAPRGVINNQKLKGWNIRLEEKNF